MSAFIKKYLSKARFSSPSSSAPKSSTSNSKLSHIPSAAKQQCIFEELSYNLPHVIIDVILEYLKDFSGTFLYKWGVKGTSNGQFSYPWCLCVDGNELFVADYYNHRVQVFEIGVDEPGPWLRNIGKGPGNGAGELQNPMGVSVSKTEVFVTDELNLAVHVFDRRTGVFARKWKLQGEGRLNSFSIEVFADEVWVGDSTRGRVLAFDHFGKLLKEFVPKSIDGVSTLRHPYGLVKDKNLLYLAEYHSGKISVWNLDTEECVLLIGEGVLKHPWIVRLIGDQVVVSDAGKHHISIFSRDGKFIKDCGSEGSADGQLSNVVGVAAWQDMVFVADTYNHRIQVFY